jgi:hypothetical protein
VQNSLSATELQAMKDKPATPRRPPTVERRSGVDRRVADLPPPGKIDRRRNVDARKPEVIELDMSNSEWSTLSQSPETPAKSA